jgi:RNA polymerase sigma-70 factor (ECF subfamily)
MDRTGSLASAWLPACTEAGFSSSELDEFVRASVTQAEREHPGITLDPGAFVAYVAARIPDAAGLRAAHWADLYLACACAKRHPAAAARLDSRFLSEVPRYILHISQDAAFAAEVRQRLLVRVLGEGDEAPRILDYSGRGPLGAWVRVAAIRDALNIQQSQRRSDAREQAWSDDAMLAPQRSPELELLRRRCAADVRVALEETLSGLDRDARNVLRMHYIDGLSGEEIALAYGVHRATVARWIQQAQAKILTETRRSLADRLRLKPTELDSLLALVQTSLNVSLCRLLSKPDEPESA